LVRSLYDFVCQEEKLRQEAIKKAEEERRIKHKKMEEERENLRQNIRDKVRQPCKSPCDIKYDWPVCKDPFK